MESFEAVMSKYKVMLVDDEKDVMDMICARIDWNACGLDSPVYAANGLEALELAEQVHPDIVMTDIKMPYMDGLELSRQLKQLYPNIRIIILSGFDEFEYAKEAVSLNAEEYLLKPIDAIQLQQVFTRIKNALDKEISERQNQQMLENYYRQSLPVLQENFFASLVQGSIPPEEYEKYLHDYQISMPGPFYACAVLYTSTNHVPKGMDYMLLFMSVRKLAEEKISSKWKPYYFNYLSHLCMVISLQKKEDITEFTDELDRFCRLAHSMVNAVVTAGIGQVCASPRRRRKIPRARLRASPTTAAHQMPLPPVRAITASRAPVEPLTWYRVSPLPKSRAARAMLSARTSAGAWRSSKPGSSVMSSSAPRVLR